MLEVGAMPNVPIEVDRESGRWYTDGLPMLYVPAHFFLNNHQAVEAAIGPEKYAQILYDAGYHSAWTWCEHEAKVHGLSGEELFTHYLTRLSERGWAQFTVESFSLDKGEASISFKNSVFSREPMKESTDYMFTGWFAGAMAFILSTRGSPFEPRSRQTEGEIHGANRAGRFQVESIYPD